MNTRTLLAPAPLDRPSQPPAPATRPDTDNITRTTRIVAPQAYPDDEPTAEVTPAAPPEVAALEGEVDAAAKPEITDLEVNEAGDDGHPSRRGFWARLLGARNPDRPKRETRREHKHHDDEERQHSVPQRPDFLADAAMAREMFRL